MAQASATVGTPTLTAGLPHDVALSRTTDTTSAVATLTRTTSAGARLTRTTADIALTRTT